MVATSRILTFAAVGELVTGAALLTVPAWVGRLLLGVELTGPAATVARVTGIALIALGIACWPGTPRAGMLTYSAAITLYLAGIGLAGSSGVLLWPVVVLHAILTALLAQAVVRERRQERQDRLADAASAHPRGGPS